MRIEERAAILRDKFNYLVKQYKKIEKKKSSGKESARKEGEEIKNELALFFKEYGSFIRARKNSFGTFDIESYILHHRKMYSSNSISENVGGSSNNVGNMNISNSLSGNLGGSNVVGNHSTLNKGYTQFPSSTVGPPKDYNILNLSKSTVPTITSFTSFKSSGEDKTYSELYKPDFNRPKEMTLNKSEGYSYSFKNVLNTPYSQDLYKTLDPVSHRMTPLADIHKPTNLKPREDFSRYTKPGPPQGNPVRGQFMRQYHTDFINGYYKPEQPSSSLSPSFSTQTGASPQSSTNGFYEQYVNKKLTVYDFIKDNDKSHYGDNRFDKSHYGDIKFDKSHYSDNKFDNTKYDDMPFAEDKKLYRSTTSQQNVTVLPQINTIYSNPNLYSKTPQINRQPFVSGKMHFSPEFNRQPPPVSSINSMNIPPWKNQYVDSFNLQGRTPVPQYIRSNTYTSLKTNKHPEKPKRGECPEVKRKKEIVIKKKEIVKCSPPPVSSSTSEDYQKYFLEDLLRESGKSTSLPPATSSFLYEFCDNFFEHMMVMTCALASNDKRKKVEFKDIKLMLKTEFDLELPEETNVKM